MTGTRFGRLLPPSHVHTGPRRHPLPDGSPNGLISQGKYTESLTSEPLRASQHPMSKCQNTLQGGGGPGRLGSQVGEKGAPVSPAYFQKLVHFLVSVSSPRPSQGSAHPGE